MSRPVMSTLPSCTSLGWTNRMSSTMSSSLRSMAHTRPSKSLRVTSRYRAPDIPLMIGTGWDGFTGSAEGWDGPAGGQHDLPERGVRDERPGEDGQGLAGDERGRDVVADHAALIGVGQPAQLHRGRAQHLTRRPCRPAVAGRREADGEPAG